MKIKCSFTIDVDVEAWMREYGVAREDVRADVQSYAENGMKDQMRDLGLLVEGS